MSTDGLTDLGIREARDLLDARKVSAVELTEAVLDRIRACDSGIGAFLLVTDDLARRQATAADERIAAGEASRLTGIPYALKDIISTTGIRTSCGSRILENYVPVYQGQVADRLQAQGAVLLGKTNMDEFAMGSSNEHSGYFPVHNPWDPDRVPGGSSGGSAAAVASGMAVFALGTDTGGSIRQPAALTGVVGIKPSYGRVSRYGLVAFASSLDQIGPFGRSVEDAALVLQVISGRDDRDSTSLDLPVPDYGSAIESAAGGSDVTPLAGMRVGIPREYFPDSLDPGVRESVEDAVRGLERLGATLLEVSLPATEAALACYYIIAPSEAMSNLARYDGVRFGARAESDDVWEMFDRTRENGFGQEVKRRILLGAFALSKGYYDAYYVKAQQVRALVTREFDVAFQSVDVIVGPTSPTTAFRLGERIDDPVEMYLADAFTLPSNIAGICGMSVPCGLADGLPVGLQVLAPRFGENAMLRVAAAYEAHAGLRLRPPPVGAGSPG